MKVKEMQDHLKHPNYTYHTESLDDLTKKLSHEPYMRIGSLHQNSPGKWELKYRNESFVNQIEHQSRTLEDALEMFERFCKGCGYKFAGFAVVDEDGIPVNGLNPMARLESGKENEDTSS